MSVVTHFEDAGPCRKKLTIEIPPQAVQAEIGRVVDEFGRNVKIPGFRPGKVPATMIRKRFREAIEKEVIDRLLPRYWKQAQAEKDIEPLIQPQVEDLQFKEDAPLTVSLTVETRPEIALGDYKTYDLPQDPIDPTEADVEEALLQLRRNGGRWQPVERSAGRGDRIVGTSKAISGHHHHHEGEEGHDHQHAEPEVKPFYFEIGNNDNEELALALTDARAGQTVRYSQRHGEGEHAHTHEIDIAVEQVQEMVLPALDEAYAKQVGDFDTVDELRGAVTRSLRERRESDLRRRRENALLDQLRSRHPLALPEGVVRQETERMVQQFAEQIGGQGADLEQMDWGRIGEDMRPAAEKRVHARLLLDAVAREERIRLDENMFESFLAAAASQQKLSSLALRQRLAEDGRLEGVRSQMLRDQTLGWLLGEKPPGEEAEAAGE